MFFDFYISYEGRVNRRQFIIGVFLGGGLFLVPTFLTLVSSLGKYSPQFLHELFMLLFPFKRELHMANIYVILEQTSRMKKDLTLLGFVYMIRYISIFLASIVLSSFFVRRVRYLTGQFSRVYYLVVPLVLFEPSLFFLLVFALIVSDSEHRLKEGTLSFFEKYSAYVKATILFLFLGYLFVDTTSFYDFEKKDATSILYKNFQDEKSVELLSLVKKANEDITLLKKELRYVNMKYETISATQLMGRDKRLKELLKAKQISNDTPSQIMNLKKEISIRDKFIRELDNEIRVLDVSNKELKDELFLIKRRVELNKTRNK
ncbi:hypothetical protein ABMA79_11250 [Halobacteriovorax sp. HFRX-2_2]|uniref:hypothetical protein n=1 Tax=unclassified Halobacteriovorax TaxID=2639665 RepID=UPI0037120EAD